MENVPMSKKKKETLEINGKICYNVPRDNKNSVFPKQFKKV
jgi:transposase-like protein